MAFRPHYQDQHQMPGADEGAFVTQPGHPISFLTGQFEGRTIRVELEELQKAESGRKYAKVDRRPLDPPPVIKLRLFNITNPGTDKEWEREVGNYEEVKIVGILCSVDLFPVPDRVRDDGVPVPPSTAASNIPDFAASTPSQTSSSSPSSPDARHVLPRTTRMSPARGSSSFELTNSGALRLNYAAPINTSEDIFTHFPLHPFTTPSLEGGGAPPCVPSYQIPRRQPMLCRVNEADPPHDVVLRVGNHLVTESSNHTTALVGEKVVEPALIDYENKKCLVFVFGDLAVQREGTFILRYRAFDICSTTVPGGRGHPTLAELYGGPFRVYSTREFPGLEPSTNLTRCLSKYGVRVTLRDAERKSKKRSDSERERDNELTSGVVE